MYNSMNKIGCFLQFSMGLDNFAMIWTSCWESVICLKWSNWKSCVLKMLYQTIKSKLYNIPNQQGKVLQLWKSSNKGKIWKRYEYKTIMMSCRVKLKIGWKQPILIIEWYMTALFDVHWHYFLLSNVYQMVIGGNSLIGIYPYKSNGSFWGVHDCQESFLDQSVRTKKMYLSNKSQNTLKNYITVIAKVSFLTCSKGFWF